MTLIPYLIFVVTLFMCMLIILEIIKRRAVENIRVSTYKAFLTYYESKINNFCKDKGEECKEVLMSALINELANQVNLNKIRYVNLEAIYKKLSRKPNIRS